MLQPILDPEFPSPIPGQAMPGMCLLEGDEARRGAGTNAGAAVLAWLVRDGELGQVVADHLGLDLNLVEGLTVVHADDGANHLGEG